MESYNYSIIKDVISREPRIQWVRDYEISNLTSTSKNDKEVGLNLNIKDGLPCLHIRYKGFRLRPKDKIYFLDVALTPFMECCVIKQPHNYKEKVKEVDCLLSEDDIENLAKHCSLFGSIHVKFSNGDTPITIQNRYDTINDKLKLKGIQAIPLLVKSRTAEDSKNAFRQYVQAYVLALKEANVSFRKCTESPRNSIVHDHCYVYLMHDKRNGYHKIGISKEPKYREKTLQSEQPAIEMVCNKKYPSRKIAEAIEFALHKAYAEQRVRGEWFNLSEIDVQMLKETLS